MDSSLPLFSRIAAFKLSKPVYDGWLMGAGRRAGVAPALVMAGASTGGLVLLPVFNGLTVAVGRARAFALSESRVGLAMYLHMLTHQLVLLYCFVGLYGRSQCAKVVSGTIGRVFEMHSLGEVIRIMTAFAQLAGDAGTCVA